MTMTRDELARDLYIHCHDEEDATTKQRDAWVREFTYEWDEGLATDDDVADCYQRADAILEGKTTR